MKRLNFQPLYGLSSAHLQTVLSAIMPSGAAPPSTSWRLLLADGNYLSCEVSTPPGWVKTGKTIVLVHGMGGSHLSNYMIRMASCFYQEGNKVVRMNLRGCGSGAGLSKIPYSAAVSHDLLAVIEALKQQDAQAELDVIGFSLGGAIVLNLAGELGSLATGLVTNFIAICPPLNLLHTVRLIEQKRHFLYHSYYLKKICRQGKAWVKEDIGSLYDFDDTITAPLWGFKGADDYYQNSSSIGFLPKIAQATHVLFAEDDPFIDISRYTLSSLPSCITFYSTKQGGHMGFLGRAEKPHSFYWLSHLLRNWIQGDFTSNLSHSYFKKA